MKRETKRDLIILAVIVGLASYLFAFCAGLNTHLPPQDEPWCYERLAAPEGEFVILAYNIPRFGTIDYRRAYRQGDLWFTTIPDESEAIRPVLGEFMAWAPEPR